ncbi:HET domain-containing protein [Fusarium keratoplasticum]|uniref:HET domain-containing protein n=1 Tax=Fusarium keratoplasticum TaxID=1328300 RepID=A0ACC0R3W4_9HYPO|nr:HET domain-containing protein [Fusarium keratoplasticum]KAI8671451.1 HET domain-containing protein [Fusarium keratoplasticum]
MCLEIPSIMETHPMFATLYPWDTDEVLYKDLLDPSTKPTAKTGWPKVAGACNLAMHLGYEWIWIDTCCIDKSSSAELPEAVNSMFRWYQEADICIAYLADIRHMDPRPVKYVTYMRDSNWFTRGWTLQELLAPRVVEFYSGDWKHLGSRNNISLDLERITGINAAYLSGRKRVTEASVSERMSWASRRQTTRVEDMAYCLLGIFNINMPLIYGEREKAFKRLQHAIIREIDDQTILAWGTGFVGLEEIDQRHDDYQPLLARSPYAFKDCGDLVPCNSPQAKSRLEILQDGVKITSPILWETKILGDTHYNPLSGHSFVVLLAPLQCRRRSDFFDCIALVLKCENISHNTTRRRLTLEDMRLHRATQGWHLVPRKLWWTKPLRRTLIPLDALAELNHHTARQDEGLIIRTLPKGYSIKEYYDPTATYQRVPPSLRIPDAHPCGLSHPIIVSIGTDSRNSIALIIRYQFVPAQHPSPKPHVKSEARRASASSDPNWQPCSIRGRIVCIPNGMDLKKVAKIDEADVRKQWDALKAIKPDARFIPGKRLDFRESRLEKCTWLLPKFFERAWVR